MTESSLQNGFFGGFYRDPQARYAAAALADFIVHPPKHLPSYPNLWLSFGRAAQACEGVRQAFLDLAAARSDLAPEITRILAAADSAEFPNSQTLQISGPSDLDFLWSDFLLTGSAGPVERIASVLDWEDRMLVAITRWLSESVFMPWTRRSKTERLASLRARGLALDVGQPRLGNAYDVDLLLWGMMSGGFKIRAEFPFEITDAAIMHVATKGTACWSLQSNAMEHEIARTVYERVPDRGRLPIFVR